MRQRNWFLRWTIASMVAVCLAGFYWMAEDASGQAQTAAPAMAAAIDYSSVGMSVAVPKGFECVATSSIYDVMHFALAGKEHTTQAISLSVYPVGEDVTADAYAEGIFNSMPTLVFRQLRLLGKIQMKDVAGLPAAARLITYTYRGVDTRAATVYFIRELKEPKLRLFYSISVEVVGEKQASLIPTLDQVVKSVTLTEVKHPSAEVKDLQPAVTDAKNGFSIRAPQGWFVQPNGDGFIFGQTDYLLGGIAGIQVAAAVDDAPPDFDSQKCAKKCLADLLAVKNDKVKTDVISQGPALMGSDQGYQFVVEQSPQTTSAPAAEIVKARAAIVRRVLCVKGNNQPRAYVVALAGAGMNAEAATAALDKIAQSFRLLPTTTAPATSSAPATVSSNQ